MQVFRSNPEYYDVIENPIDFARISYKLKNEDYQSYDEFYEDMETVLENAKRFYPVIF